jgi:threonine aldolase
MAIFYPMWISAFSRRPQRSIRRSLDPPTWRGELRYRRVSSRGESGFASGREGMTGDITVKGLAARGFASDNAAGVHPAVLERIAEANAGHALGYGHDRWTERAQALLQEQFGTESQSFLVWGGTAANVLSLRACCRPWEAAICVATAHLNVDEAGAPEGVAGVKLLTAEGQHGKLGPELIDGLIVRQDDEHAVQPRVVSISQATELGTVYGIKEVAAIAALAHGRGLVLHMDGARLCNAAAALGETLAGASTALGVDVVSFGGTKNGLLGAEAVVFATADLANGFQYLRKQSLQLASKMRFLAAQFEALLSDELWRSLANHANQMAARLAALIGDVEGVAISHPVQANAVFATLPQDAVARLQAQFDFYVWDEKRSEVRFMCSWDTTAEDVERFAAAIRAAVG